MRYILLVLLFMPVTLVAQMKLTLEEAIRRAQENSLVSLKAYHTLKAQEFDFEGWRAGLKPQFWLKSSPSYQHTSSLQNYSFDANVEMTQAIEKWGGELYANTSLGFTGYMGSDADQMKAAQGAAHQFLAMPVQVGYRQNLIGYNAYLWERRLQEFRNDRIRSEHAYELAMIAETAASYYFSYLAQLAYYDMYRKNAETSDRLYRIGQEKFAIASIRKDELISLELQLLNMQNSLRKAENDLAVVRESLRSYLNLPDDVTELDVELPDVPQLIAIDEHTAVDYAMKYNPDYLSYQENIISQQQQVDRARRETGIQASIDVSIARKNASSNLFTSYNMKQPYTVANVTLAVPINDHGAARNRMKAAESRLRLQEVNMQERARQLREEVINTLKDFNSEQRNLSETRRAIELSDRSFEQNQYNYAQGLVDINTFTLAQDRKDQAHTNYILSVQSFWISYFKLMRLTMFDFRNNRPLK